MRRKRQRFSSMAFTSINYELNYASEQRWVMHINIGFVIQNPTKLMSNSQNSKRGWLECKRGDLLNIRDPISTPIHLYNQNHEIISFRMAFNCTQKHFWKIIKCVSKVNRLCFMKMIFKFLWSTIPPSSKSPVSRLVSFIWVFGSNVGYLLYMKFKMFLSVWMDAQNMKIIQSLQMVSYNCGWKQFAMEIVPFQVADHAQPHECKASQW